MTEHAGLVDAHAHGQQRQTEAAADEEVGPPGHDLGHQAGHDGAEDADGGDERGAIAAALLGEGFRDERDAAAELAREADAGDEAPGRVGLEAVDETVGDIGQRIEQDGSEERRQAAHAVPEDAEEDAAEEHAGHLPRHQVMVPLTALDEMLQAEIAQTLFAHGHEQGQVVDIDEVAERADDDGGVQEILPERARLGREIRGAHEGGVTPSDRAD